MGKRLTIALAVFALIAVPLAAYVGGYFWLGDFYSAVRPAGRLFIVREYPHRWQAQAFIPAARLEALIGGDGIDRVILRVAGLRGPEGLVFIADQTP